MADLAEKLDDVGAVAALWPRSVSFTGRAARHEGAYANSVHANLFVSAFPTIPAESLRQLSLAARLFGTALVEIDRFIDGDPDAAPRTLDMVAIQFECYRALATLFPGDSRVWADGRSCLIGYMDFVMRQAEFIRGERAIEDLTYAEAVAMARGKTVVEGVTLSALGELAGAEGVADSLRKSLAELRLAECFADDVQDWRRDAVAGRPSLVVAEAIRRAANLKPRPVEGWSSGDLDRIGRVVYFQGVARQVLDLALEALTRARLEVSMLTVESWIARICETEGRVRWMRDQLPSEASIKTSVQPAVSITLPSKPARPWHELARHSLRYLLREWKSGFPDAAHQMMIPNLWPADKAYDGTSSAQVGDVFSRALIARTFVDADRYLAGGQLTPLLARDIEHLLSRRRIAEPGLWAYFPELDHLPCDADVLAEVLQVLTSTGRATELQGELDATLKLALCGGARSDGSFRDVGR